MILRLIVFACLLAFALPAAEVRRERVPESGLQPEAATDAAGRTHLIYLTGDPKSADIQYVTRTSPNQPWSPPLRVNSQPGSAVAIGTVRGPRLTLTQSNQVAVVWNGSSQADPKPAESAPLLFARLKDNGTEFETQRNLMGALRHLDGGAAVASNGRGRVLVVWHAAPPAGGTGPDTEEARGVYLATSEDDGRTFTEPRRLDQPALGVCACCALEAGFQDAQNFFVLYRSATGGSERGLMELKSSDGGRTFSSRRLDNWTLNECPMTTTRLAPDGSSVVWSTRGTIQFTRLNGAATLAPVTISQGGRRANHPVIIAGGNHEFLVAWTEGTGWQRGGELAWQTVNSVGEPTGLAGQAPGVPVWGYPTAIVEADGGFTVFY